MKAVVCDGYGAPGDVLRLADVADPEVGDDAVLLRVHASSVNPADWHVIRGDPFIARLSFGLRRPDVRVPGCDVAGRVEAVGRNVTAFRPGDNVFGCPFGSSWGAFAERASVAADVVARLPAGVDFDRAAAVPLAGTTALQGLRDHGRVEAGQRVLVIGASGGVGTFAVQIAKAFGAEVTGVCSTANVELVRSLGADHVVDYTAVDLAAGGERYDVVFQAAGTRSPGDCRRLLTGEGTLVSISGESPGRVVGALGRMVALRLRSPFVSQTLTSFTVSPTGDDLAVLAGMLEAGTVTPVIDRTYPLAEVADALAYLEAGHARGKTVVTV